MSVPGPRVFTIAQHYEDVPDREIGGSLMEVFVQCTKANSNMLGKILQYWKKGSSSQVGDKQGCTRASGDHSANKVAGPASRGKEIE